jgi:hypothetical protein
VQNGEEEKDEEGERTHRHSSSATGKKLMERVAKVSWAKFKEPRFGGTRPILLLWWLLRKTQFAIPSSWALLVGRYFFFIIMRSFWLDGLAIENIQLVETPVCQSDRALYLLAISHLLQLCLRANIVSPAGPKAFLIGIYIT